MPVKMGKGRLSLAGDARCRELAALGWAIKGYQATTNPNPTTAQPVEVKKVTNLNEKVVSDFTLVYDENLYHAVTATGKVYGMREVCNKCRVSLVQNHCANPVILGDIHVTIKPKT